MISTSKQFNSNSLCVTFRHTCTHTKKGRMHSVQSVQHVTTKSVRKVCLYIVATYHGLARLQDYRALKREKKKGDGGAYLMD